MNREKRLNHDKNTNLEAVKRKFEFDVIALIGEECAFNSPSRLHESADHSLTIPSLQLDATTDDPWYKQSPVTQSL